MSWICLPVLCFIWWFPRNEREGKERLALFSALPKSIWSAAWGMWFLLLSSDREFCGAGSISNVSNSSFSLSLGTWGLAKCASWFWVVKKGAVFFCGTVSGSAPKDLGEFPYVCLPWRKIWALYNISINFSVVQGFLRRRWGALWTVIRWSMVSKKHYHSSTAPSW